MPTGPRLRLGRASASEPPQAPAPLDVEALEEALEAACLDAFAGDPAGDPLARRLERVCTGVLRGHGLAGARVRARALPEGMEVAVQLPPDPRRVRQLVIGLRTRK